MRFENKFQRKRFLLILVCVSLALVTVVANAETLLPGSSGDPVVTKSYVDTKLAELESKLSTQGGSETYTPVMIPANKTLIGGQGTEIIFRAGEATTIDNGANGVSDITAGKDLRTGESLTLNHLLVIPKEDGRGIKANTEVWVLIRGAYKLN